MPKGKAPESAELKAVVEAFENLSDTDKTFFRNKVFAKICNGLTKEQRESFKKERLEFLGRIDVAKKAAEQLEAVAAIPTEELEKILAERKKTAKK